MNAAAFGPGNAVPRCGTGPSGVETGTAAGSAGLPALGTTEWARACSMVIAPPDHSMRITRRGFPARGKRRRAFALTKPQEPPGYRIRAPYVSYGNWPVRLPLGWDGLLYNT